MEHTEMPEPNGEVTILDVLGVDLCREAILDQVHIRDIVRSERVCRRWRRAVLDYLPRCRNLTLSIYQRSRVLKYSHRTVMLRDHGSLPIRSIVQKLGPLIISLYTNRSDPEFYEDISAYCPRLRYIELKHLRTGGPKNISEQKLGRAFQNMELEKVKLVNCTTVTGTFFQLLNSNSLKSLSLLICNGLEDDHIKSNASRLHNVTTLEILILFQNHFVDALSLLENMPNLENISLKGVWRYNPVVESQFLDRCNGLHNSKCIDLRQKNVTDEFLEGLAKVCKNLEYLNIAGSINSPCGRGLAALVFRPSPGTILCFTRIRKESLEALLEYLTPLNDKLEARGRKKVTLEMLKEASKSIEQCDLLELRLANPVVRKMKSHPELKIILNVSLVRHSDAPDNNIEQDWLDAPNNVEIWEQWVEEGVVDNDVPGNVDAYDNVNIRDNVNAPNDAEDWQELNEERIVHNDADIVADGPDNIDAATDDEDYLENVDALYH